MKSFYLFWGIAAISVMSPGPHNGCFIRILTSTDLVSEKYVKIYLILFEYEGPLLKGEP